MSFGIPVRNGLGVGLLASTSLATRNNVFTPASLFAAGEQGYWLDPSDFSTMFQDAAGTTPVTAVGQSVGFLGDKSRGFALGPEAIVNGNFATDSDWVKGTGWTIGGGAATLSVGAAFASLRQDTLTIGKSYLVEFDFTPISGQGVRLDVGGVTYISNDNVAGRKRVIATAVASTRILFANGLSAAANFTIDNVTARELPGNHFTQSNVSLRPILGRVPFGGRRNLLTYTEQFDNGVWTKNELAATANAGVAPDGTTTADRLTPNAGLVTPFIFQAAATTASAFTVSFYAKADGYNFVQLSDGVSVTDYCNFNLSTGAVGASSGYTGSITNAGNGWYRCAATKTFTAVSTEIRIEPLATDIASRRPNYTANGTSGILIWGAQLETGSTATAYQRVTTAFDVTQAGVADCYYLSFDGTDDWLQSAATIDPGAVDKAQVFTGVRKLSDAAIGMVVEASTSSGGNIGALGLSGPGNAASNDYRWTTRGTATATIAPTGFTAPITNVLTGIGDIAADTCILRANGVEAAQTTSDQGTGNYLTYIHYIGRRGGTSLPFNGRVYQMVMRYGANLTAGQITQTETFVNSKTGAY